MLIRLRRLRAFLCVAGLFSLIYFGASIAGWTGPLAAARPVTPPAALAVGSPFPGETYSWRPVAIGGGGFITGLSMDSSGKTLVARTDVYGAYLWQPALDRWTQLVSARSMPVSFRMAGGMAEGAYEVVVAPSNPDRLYLAIKGNIFRSDDRGAHWRLASASKPFPLAFDPNSEFRFYGPFITVSTTDPDLLFFGSPVDGLWRSADGGCNWQRIASVPPGADLRPDPGVQSPGIVTWFQPSSTGRSRIWAMSPGHGLFVSSDGGLQFSPLSGGGGPLVIQAGAFTSDGSFLGTDPERQTVWRYRDGQWNDLRTVGLPAHIYGALAINPRNGAIFALDDGGAIFRSTDGGDSWRHLLHRASVGTGDPPWLHVANTSYFATSQILFDAAVPDRIWLGSGVGPFFADVTAYSPMVSWVSQVRGIEELVANDVVQPAGRAPLFAAWDFGIHLKEDLNRYSTGYGPKERMIIAAQQVDWSANHPDTLVTNASDTRHCCSEDGDTILAGYSDDAGRNWHKFATLPQPPGTQADDPWRMAFGTIAVSADNPDNIVWEPSDNRAPFVTHDRGRNWQRVIFPQEQLPLTGAHARYALNRKTLTADRARPGTFYLVHSGNPANAALTGLWRTTDGGVQWSRIFSGEIAPSSAGPAKLRAVPGHAGHLFFTSAVRGIPDTGLRRSVDGGQTWTVVKDVDRVDDIAFGKSARGHDYPAIFLSGRVRGEYGLWRSIDATANWQKIADLPLDSLDQVSVLGADPDVFGRVYIGYTGSGWLYGEPAHCPATSHDAPDQRQCYRVH